MYFSNSVLLLSVLGASNVLARVSPAHRRHQQFHDEQKRAVGDLVTATIDGVVVYWTNEWSGSTAAPVPTGVAPPVENVAVSSTTLKTSTSTTPTPTPSTSTTSSTSTTPTTTSTSTPVTTSSAAAAATSSSSSSSSGTGASSYTGFCSSSSKKRATAEEIAYTGNTGTSSDWGCNMQLIQSSIASSYDYTVKFTGQNTEKWTCACWNKIGPDGGINGWFGHEAVSFSLEAGGEQYVAFDSNSQGGCSCGAGNSVPTDTLGEFAATWFEFDFDNTSNNGWSGADASSLVAQAAGMSVQGMQVCGSGTCSTIKSGGVGTNAYTKGMEAADGVGLNLAAGKVSLSVVIDYQG